jgi:c-di-GMP-binding flagellar brake protein YcgR
MAGFELRLGDRLEVLWDDRRAASMIETITPEGRLIISEPMYGLGRLPVKKNNVLVLSVFRETGVLSFTVTAERIIQEGELTLIEVQIRSKVSRHQRRNYVRFETTLPMTAIPLYKANEDQISDREAVGLLTARRLAEKPRKEDILAGTTLDISGGGTRFSCTKELLRGAVADCEINLTDGSKITASIRILRVEHERHEGKSVMGAKFIGIQEVLREQIIKYIFAEQLRKRRNS